MNILLVDDQPAKLLTYEAILADLGENLIRAGSAREALEHLLQTDIAVVLVDVCMPDMDGYELAEMIRKHPRCQQTAIILVSAILMTDFDRLKGYDRGAVDYVPVPIIPEILRAKVSVFVDLYRKTQELHRLNRDLEQRVEERTAALETFTERLRESEERFRGIFNQSTVGIAQTDLAGRFVMVNPTYAQLVGRSPETLLNLALGDILHAEDRAKYLPLFERTATAGEPFTAESRYVLPDGSEILVSSSVCCIRDPEGKPEWVSVVVQDITERVRLEAERRQLLDSERAARAQAERAGQVKDEFLATLSHELRTPLSSILLCTHLLQRGRRDEATLAEGLANIEECARAQNRLVEDLLDMSRIVSGKFQLDLHPLEFGPVVVQALDMIRPTAQAKKIEVRHEVNPQAGLVRGDAHKLRQVAWNLLSNAVKFSHTGGEVRVSLARTPSHVELQVSDDGQGISSDFLPYIFDRFRQGDSSIKRKHEGMGLGLALVKHFVELHGGAVTAESAGAGKGTTVSVRLPVAAVKYRDREHGALERLVDEIDLRGARVLVVDDDPGTRELLSRMLSEYDAEVRIESSADAGLAALEEFNPDVLVSDIGMPGKDGYEFIRELRRLESPRSRLPAVALTAHARPEDRARALESGFNMHVAKPIDPYEFLIVIEALARSSVERRTEGVAAASNT